MWLLQNLSLLKEQVLYLYFKPTGQTFKKPPRLQWFFCFGGVQEQSGFQTLVHWDYRVNGEFSGIAEDMTLS